MDFPPLQRHPALQPLSREHFNGLRQARLLTHSAEQTVEERRSVVESFMLAWRQEIEPHFADEERLLSSLIDESDRNRLFTEHAELRQLVGACEAALSEPPVDLVQRLGMLLRDHIRWEERHLFENAQQRGTPGDFEAIAVQTAQIEVERPGARPRRTMNNSG